MKKFLFFILLCTAHVSFGQDTTVLRSSNFGKLHELGLWNALWYFHPGELTSKHQPLTTLGWDTLHNTSFGSTDLPRGWRGQGWFGLWVKADSGLLNKKLSFRINHDGASEIFMDGKPMGGYGKLGNSAGEMEAIRAPKDLIPLWLSDNRPHLISIHYNNFVGVFSNFYGFQVDIGDYRSVSLRMRRNNQFLDAVPWFAFAQLILGLLHFFFFLFYPKQKLNLYYAFFVLLVGINGLAIYLFYQTRFPSVQFFAEYLTCICKVLIMWSAVLLLYALNYHIIPRWRVSILAIISIAYLVGYTIKYLFFPVSTWEDYFSFIFLLCITDGCWSAYQVISRRQKGVWLVGVGVAAVIILYFFASADVFGLWPYYLSPVRVFVLSAGEMVLPICLSLYLAIDFASTNQRLIAKLSEVEHLSAQTVAQEIEKAELIAGEAKRLEQLVALRTTELREKADQLKELDTLKSRFFTNITHEFKTPLTLIINPTRALLIKAENKDQQQQFRLVLNNANRLLGLINQLLDLSKLENGLMEVSHVSFDLIALINANVQSYSSSAIQKGNQLYFVPYSDTMWLSGDRDKIDMIIINLLSNAMKFTENGKIEVYLQTFEDHVGTTFTLIVRDTGSGIPTEKLPYIFERFYQVDASDTRSAEGTGIGLSLTKELVELLGGHISAQSLEGLYTEIKIKMPCQLIDVADEHKFEFFYDDNLVSNSQLKASDPGTDVKPLLLLIEDHTELRYFLKQSLENRYRVLTAKDGKEGIAIGLLEIPNLIITDLMMPLIDGYMVSSTFKTDERTSHIPIIILTAKTDMDSRIQGIETGADAYLAKPFDQRELLALIENLINMRSRLREQYAQQNLWFNSTSTMPSIEQGFLGKIRKAVEEHIKEEGYSVEQLATDVGLSRAQMHRKLKGIIGQAPGELIRAIRLHYAHDLLQRQISTVAEVAYMVGFGSPASFSASFSRHFGFPPSKVC